MIVRSSACSATFAYQSETHIPLCPYCFHLRRDAINVLCAVPRDVCEGLPIESGMGLPSSLVSSGFGSNRSTWLGPPSMNRKMTDFAVGVWWGFFGASGSCATRGAARSEEHTSELQSQSNLVCRLLLEKKKKAI